MHSATEHAPRRHDSFRGARRGHRAGPDRLNARASTAPVPRPDGRVSGRPSEDTCCPLAGTWVTLGSPGLTTGWEYPSGEIVGISVRVPCSHQRPVVMDAHRLCGAYRTRLGTSIIAASKW